MSMISLLLALIVGSAVFAFTRYMWQRMNTTWQSKLLLTLCLFMVAPGMYFSWKGYPNAAALFLSIGAALGFLEQFLRYLHKRKALQSKVKTAHEDSK